MCAGSAIRGDVTDYTLSDWIADARLVLDIIKSGPPITIVGNSLGGWIAWLMAQECAEIERLILIAPAFNMMGVRARSISPNDDMPGIAPAGCPGTTTRSQGLAALVEMGRGKRSLLEDQLRPLRPVKTTILHGLQDTVILPRAAVSSSSNCSRAIPRSRSNFI